MGFAYRQNHITPKGTCPLQHNRRIQRCMSAALPPHTPHFPLSISILIPHNRLDTIRATYFSRNIQLLLGEEDTGNTYPINSTHHEKPDLHINLRRRKLTESTALSVVLTAANHVALATNHPVRLLGVIPRKPYTIEPAQTDEELWNLFQQEFGDRLPA